VPDGCEKERQDGPGGDRSSSWTTASSAMERILAGEASAFLDLYIAVAPRLRNRLVRIVRDEARAEDLLQQTFLQIHLSLARFTPGAALGPWVITIAQRLLLNELRRMRTESRALGAMSNTSGQPFWRNAQSLVEDLVDAKQLANRIGDKLDGLPASHRRAFQLVRHQGLTMAEASKELGVSVGAVKVRVHRATRALRDKTIRVDVLPAIARRSAIAVISHRKVIAKPVPHQQLHAPVTF
jgi:RNA polymerase sigma-70 factor (ECF subfamily)